MLAVRTFGGLRLEAGSAELALPADARARELLAWLALHPGVHGRSALAGVLRPDAGEDSARQTLRNAVYELRRALGAHAAAALITSRDAVGLADAVRVDAREFARLRAAGRLEAAVALSAGELLAGLDTDWALRARDEHAAELAAALGALAAAAERDGDLPAALAWTRRRLEVEPLAEAAHRELIRLLALGGDRAAALAAANVLAERLRSELGIPPSAATRALVEAVRRGRVAGDVPDAAVAPPLPATLAGGEDPEGRASDLGRLEREWAEAKAGGCRVALVTGEAGIGKTTLAGALARRAHAEGAAVLLGRCDEQALVPFQPWVEALEGLLDALPDAAADAWLAAHEGALARLLPTRGPAPADDPRQRYLAFEVVRALLADVSARRPVLLVLDDVHWADADSLALLRHVARSAPRARLLVVLCARPDEPAPVLAQTLADLRREGPATHVELTGLDQDAVAALLARRTGSADPSTARRLHARSGGNPFFLGELLREAQEAGVTAERPPAGVREVLARRLGRLDATTLRVLEVAAVCGVSFDVRTLAPAAGRSVAEVLEALDPAADAALVVATDERGSRAFAHALVAETIAGGLPGSRRARLHLAVADVLAARHEAGEAHAGDVARHLRAAGPLVAGERLAAWELAAAREATAALAHADAAAHYEAALTLGAREPERPELLLALGHAHDRAGRRARARAAFLEAAELARRSGDAGLLGRAALGHGGVAVVITAADHVVAGLLEEALRATPGDEPATAARLLARLSIELYYTDRARARELSARAVEQAQRAGDPAVLAAALNARRVALWAPDHAEERLAAATDMIAAAEAAGDREATLQGRNWRVVDLLELGRVADATAEVDAYEALADEVALPHFRWYVPLWRATLSLLAARWDDARERCDQALALGRRADDPNAPVFTGIQRHHALYCQRRIGELGRQRLVDGAAASPAAAEWLVNLALIDAETGAIAEARRLVGDLARDGGRALAMDANWHAVCVLAEAAVTVGDREAAGSLHRLLEPHARLFPVIARGVGGLGSAELFAGRLAGALGRHDEAETRLRRAVEANERAGVAPWGAVALLRLGETLGDRGRHDAARDVLQQAAGRAEALDMPVLAADVRRRLAAGSA